MKDQLLNIKVFVEPTFGENALLVSIAGGAGRVGWAIDPSFKPHVDHLINQARDQGVTIEKIVLTHGHGDHIAGVDAVKATFPQASVLIAAEDEPLLRDAERNLSAPFGVDISVKARVDQQLVPGMELTLGATRWLVLDTSGHSPGGRSLYCAQAGVVIVGDALFAGSIGRTDFPGSDHRQLLDNIRLHLLTLPGNTVVYS
ncbi:MAG: MBL fold metallo-hydrolase, partial [Planctomycetes bacterium]|nr:MBL fold metallo-hydrolase [Planctomycetota bacterium]